MVPNGWSEKHLGDLCTIKTGKKDVNQGNPLGEYPFFTCAQTHTYSDEYSFDCEALLIPGNGDIGSVFYYLGKFEAYQRTYVLSRFYGIDVFYLYQYLDYFFKRDVHREKQKGAMPYIKLGLLKNFRVGTPPLPEQKKIARILSTWDKAIETVDKLIENSQQQKKALMQQLLTGKKRLPGFSGEWKEASLDSIVYRPIAYGVLKPGDYDKGGIPLIRIQDVKDSAISHSELFRISKDLDLEYKRTSLNQHDLIVSIVGTLGRIFMVTEGLAGANVSRAFAVVGIDTKKANPNYIMQYLLSEKVQDWMTLSSAGNAQKVVNLGTLKKLSIPLPKREEQDYICSVLHQADLAIGNIRQQYLCILNQKQALMQQLLTGKRRVKVDDDRSPTQAG